MTTKMNKERECICNIKTSKYGNWHNPKCPFFCENDRNGEAWEKTHYALLDEKLENYDRGSGTFRQLLDADQNFIRTLLAQVAQQERVRIVEIVQKRLDELDKLGVDAYYGAQRVALTGILSSLTAPIEKEK